MKTSLMLSPLSILAKTTQKCRKQPKSSQKAKKGQKYQILTKIVRKILMINPIQKNNVILAIRLRHDVG